jgi:hypothetical protein
MRRMIERLIAAEDGVGRQSSSLRKPGPDSGQPIIVSEATP